MRFCVLVFICGVCASASAQHSRAVEELPGQFTSPDGHCTVALRINRLGGAKDLFLVTARTKSTLIEHDVTGIAWFSNNALAFTVSPIYGRPGVYVLDCKSSQAKRVVRPKTLNQAYPEGADYFELYRVSDDTPAMLFFYYAPDVDKVDFASFRTPDHLFEVRSNGAGFRNAVNTNNLPREK